MFRALPVVSTSAPMPVAVIGRERTGCWVVPVDPVVPLACWLRLPRVPASTAAVRLVVRVAAAWPPGPPCPVWPPGPAWPVPPAAACAAAAAFFSLREEVPTTALTLGTPAAVAA